MPRKIITYDDYEDEFEDYDDYGWEEEEEVEKKKPAARREEPQPEADGGLEWPSLPIANQDQAEDFGASARWEPSGLNLGIAPSSAIVWRCPVCTYDNPPTYLACDVCGEVRREAEAEVPHQTAYSDWTAEADSFGFNPAPAAVKGAPQRRAVNLKLSGTGRIAEKSTILISSLGEGAHANGSNDQARSGSAVAAGSDKGKGKAASEWDDDVAWTEREDGEGDGADVDRAADGIGRLSTSGREGDGAKLQVAAAQKGLPLEKYKPEGWILEGRAAEKGLLHLVVVGHVDAGKSTLMGHLLHRLGNVSNKEMHKNTKESKEKGKGSFAFAWVLDESAEERARGVTMSVAVAHFKTPRLQVVLLDAPGHQDFVPKMIAGAAQADAAVLVIDAAPGALLSGLEGARGSHGGGQTREHAQLVRSLGVEDLIVAVNKMDIVDYAEEEYEEIKGVLAPFLKQCGFRDGKVTWVPLSGLDGQNLAEGPTDPRFKKWWEGPCLLEAIDSCATPVRQVDRPLRLVIAESLRSRSLGQAAVSGKLEGGGFKPGGKVLVKPIGELATVKVIERNGSAVPEARAGDSVDVGLLGCDPAILVAGGVLCHVDYPVPVVTRFEAQIRTLGISRPLLKGTQVRYCNEGTMRHALCKTHVRIFKLRFKDTVPVDEVENT
eukprot:TRINITY_DN18028_c0_g1_i1.p1 TRINITY_DN18028_c0_g1~~TRINITY_DN18028_c0_g1_i1.p1  ORF type:complete len:662 (-),score=107.99 TRINITY_DN18028_c0_g1_i1:50-2035(-)